MQAVMTVLKNPLAVGLIAGASTMLLLQFTEPSILYRGASDSDDSKDWVVDPRIIGAAVGVAAGFGWQWYAGSYLAAASFLEDTALPVN